MVQLSGNNQNPDFFMGDTRATTGDHVPQPGTGRASQLTARYMGELGIGLDVPDRQLSHVGAAPEKLKVIGSNEPVADSYYADKKRKGLL